MTPTMPARATAAQARAELTLTLRRGESVLVTVIIPTALMVFFATARVLPASGRTIAFLLPGTITLAVISTGLVSLGIATAYERYYGVLKRLGTTPLPRLSLITAKLISVLVLEIVQIALLVAIATVAFGWRPAGALPLAAGALLLGTAAFAGLGLLIAGSLKAETTLALANGLFLAFLLLGGLYVPLDHLPALLVPPARLLPATVLADVLRASLATHTHVPFGSLALLAAWAVGAPALAAVFFRWE